ncbi:DUF1684 domain-containing protein [Cryobacterium sp. RTS3]|uniref:DUF1684 domain-containing protein n=1 Tax=Cryobacterium sp. RTS3 TaxID=3048643 RepID=UPI002B238403|nr:DUF1684 domain-containing protein [Cryobacterium sp. RTS3]MEA9997614.1 DUF1684 domain-containing protein [Cryobacterium sp. RTS3]
MADGTATQGSVDQSGTDAALAELAEFRDGRTRAVVGPRGNLALVNTQWITGDPAVGQPIWGVPGLWAPLPAGVSGLSLTATASDGIIVDGDVVDGSVLVAGLDAMQPSGIRFSETLTGTVIAGEDGGYGLRVWDAASEGIRDFGRIDAFPFDPEWVVEATFTPIPGRGEVSTAHLQDEGRTRQRALPGEITFTRDGIDYNLVAFEDGPSLFLVFADATNGVSTYSVGRFLRVSPEGDGTIRLDFNRAYLPPCAFSYNFNCPIAPAQNRLAIPIEAGERMVLAADGTPLHD